MLFRRRLHATNDELNAYLDGALGESVRERIRGHVHACAICQEALEGLRAVQVSLRGLQAKAPRSFALREAAVRPALARPAGGLARATPLLSGVTALALIAFFAVVSVDMAGDGGGSQTASGALPGALRSAATGDDAYQAVPGAADTASLGEIERTTEEGQRLTVTASGAAFNGTGAPPSATPEPEVGTSTDEDGDDDMKLRIAEGALAALALVSGGSALVLVRRRRA